MGSTSTSGRTVVLADRELLSRHCTRLLLEQWGYAVVAETDDGSKAVEIVDQLQPDLLVADLDLSLLPGLEVIRLVRRQSPRTAVLVLTQVDACASVIGAVKAGATGYCLRTGSPEEFSRAIDALLHGDMYVCPRVAKHLVPGRCECSETAADCRGLDCLTGREVQILKLVAEGYSSPQIGGLLDLSAATVDRHRANLMQKLNLHSVSALVLFAARCGVVDLHRVSA